MFDKKERYLNREISWLQFNERVLQEAKDSTTPLMERLIFLGIFSNNLDEFFKVRVATLNRLVKLRQEYSDEFGFNHQRTLRDISEFVGELQTEFSITYNQILKELEKEKIHILNEAQLTSEQGGYVIRYFRDNVRQHLFPIMLEVFEEIENLQDKSIYLVVDLFKTQDPGVDDHALIKIPTSDVSRFLILPPSEEGRTDLIFLDDVIRYCLWDVFSIFGYDKFTAYTIKFTRDAELDIDNDVSKSFLEIMTESVKQRKHGATVRFIYDSTMPEDLRDHLVKKFKIKKKDTLKKGGRYHNNKDLMNFPRNVGGAHLWYEPMQPMYLHELPLNKSIFDVIRRKDVMLHYPYQTFQYIVDLLREASIDPHVRAIKITIYRAATNSSVINALINAARNGKHVTVYLELQARFDEQNNIYWASKLQEEGVKVVQSIPGYKVHCKLILIRRKENGQNVYYAAIGTGNHNEQTAKVYADEHLLTSNQEITNDVNQVFHLFDARYNRPDFQKLIVSPFNTRDFFMNLIDQEIANAKAGKKAWMILKMNNLVDKRIVDKLYEASQANVKINLIIRGICVLIPGIPDVSENIEAISIVDRYLEHSRIVVFCNNEDPLYFTGSSDWMQRNFDHRIEVMTPILDKEIQLELWQILQIQLADNVKSRYISTDNPNNYKLNNYNFSIRAQSEIYKFLRSKH